MSGSFTRTFHVRWGDMDFNAHMRNTAYLDLSADVRMLFFEASGFSMREFERLRIGPVITRDEVDYYREMRLLEPVTVTLSIAGANDGYARFRMRNEFFNQAGKRTARVTSNGGWLDLDARKLTTIPPALIAALDGLERTEDFVSL